MAPDRKTAFDTSGLGGSPRMVRPTLTWININTDGRTRAVHFRKGHREAVAQHAQPGGRNQLDPGAFVPDIIKGFTTAYRSLMRHREALLQPRAARSITSGDATPDIVLRPTQTYASLLHRSLTPRLLRNGLDRSLEFEVLSRTMLLQSNDAEGALLFRSEVESAIRN